MFLYATNRILKYRLSIFVFLTVKQEKMLQITKKSNVVSMMQSQSSKASKINDK